MPTAAAWKQAAKQYHNFIGGQIELQHQTEKDYRTLQREHRALRETACALAQALRHVENVWCWWLEGGTSADAMEALIDMAKPLNNGGLLDSPAVRELLEPSESKHERE
jgi:muramidase (phage lysozyme)